MNRPTVASAGSLSIYYAAYFGCIGIILPFLPAYLKSIGFSATQVGLLLAIGPTLALLVPNLWAHLADRSGRADRVLIVLSAGAFLFFLPLLRVRTFAGVFAALTAYGAFQAAITTLVDTITLHRVHSVGGSFSRIRVFGSLAFVVSSSAYGLAVREIGPNAVIVAAGMLFLLAAASLAVRSVAHVSPSDSGPKRAEFIRTYGLGWFLAATSLHWLACAPFNGSFAIHLQSLGLAPWLVGTSASAGVLAESVMMYFYPNHFSHLSAKRFLAFAFAMSALRWAGMSVAVTPLVVLCLSLLHAFTFGAFYVAAVSYVAGRVPEPMRARGQAIFMSLTFGLGGLLGFVLAGVTYDRIGGRALFGIAFIVDLIAAIVILKAKEGRTTSTKPFVGLPATPEMV